MTSHAGGEQRLGAYLRDRRSRLDPASFGFPVGRRRTPGLRREEVAQRANISPTWYTWLEQGRGGAPSADVLERIAGALMLTELEREHMFLLGLGRPPEARYRDSGEVEPRLQRVLAALEPTPALIRTATWDVVAWNRAVAVLVTDYGALPPGERNILRSIFLDPNARAAQKDWTRAAQYVVGAFRLDAARAGIDAERLPLVEVLRRQSPEFEAMWRENELPGHPAGAVKQIRHPTLGPVSFEYSAFAIDARPDLSMVVYNPVDAADRERVRAGMEARTAGA